MDQSKEILDSLKRIEDNQKRLEKKLDELDTKHDSTRERQIRLESEFKYYEKNFERMVEKQEKDKKIIYDNMDEKIKKSVTESILKMKVWIYGGGGTIIVFLAGIYGKIKGQ